MNHYIPETFVKSDEFSGMKATAVQDWSETYPIIKLEAGCFALEIDNADSIRRLKELCEFALTKP